MVTKPAELNVMDDLAKAIAADVAHQIKLAYPDVDDLISWNSCKKALASHIRKSLARLGDAAERGMLAQEITKMKSERHSQAAEFKTRRAFRSAFARDITPASSN